MTIMGGIAEFERGLIRKRCVEGIERAKLKGTKFGRRSVLDVGKRKRIAERYAAGETIAQLARDSDCGEATIWRALHLREGWTSRATPGPIRTHGEWNLSVVELS
jgi:DNA invertase Pin-like site-specific DNA recombinase